MNQLKEAYKVLGLMSGTSLDGLDICLVEFKYKLKKWSFNIIEAETIEYPGVWINKLRSAENLSASQLIKLDRNYGEYLGKCSHQFLEKNHLNVDLISSHGHTVFHQPQNGFTLQLGHGACIAAKTKTPVVNDFRSLDIALGGQGAPLVPFGDRYLFGEYVACLNIGGITNLSINADGKTIAFDIAPANMVLNHICRKYLNLEFDQDGQKSRQGKLNLPLLDKLNDWNYYKQEPPKSLGKEDVFEFIIPIIETSHIPVEDKLYTFTLHVVDQINRCIEKNNLNGKILVSGGGAKNKFLTEQLNSKHRVYIPELQIIDFKEALIFAFLGLKRFLGEVNVFKSVTGASKDHSAGAIHLP